MNAMDVSGSITPNVHTAVGMGTATTSGGVRSHMFGAAGHCLPVPRNTHSTGLRLGRGSNCWGRGMLDASLRRMLDARRWGGSRRLD